MVDPTPPAGEWLDALSGRAPAGTDADADRLRAALLPLPEARALPDWHTIEARAGAAAGAADPRPEAAAVPRTDRAQVAANQPWFAQRWAWAASLALAVGLGLWMAPPEESTQEPALRGGSPAGAAAVWVTPDPGAQAQALAADLRTAGAVVRVDGNGADVVLQIEAPAAARAAVEARLQPLETGLDLAGRLTLRVRAPR